MLSPETGRPAFDFGCPCRERSGLLGSPVAVLEETLAGPRRLIRGRKGKPPAGLPAREKIKKKWVSLSDDHASAFAAAARRRKKEESPREREKPTGKGGHGRDEMMAVPTIMLQLIHSSVSAYRSQARQLFSI